MTLFLTVSVMAITGCGGGPQGGASVSGSSWTVMIYLDADNNLDQISEHALREMQKVGSSEEITVVLQYDTRASSAKRCKVERGKLSVLADLGEVDMASPAVLADFISFAAKSYPADHYALIISDHGDGWKSSPKRVGSLLEDWTNNGTATAATGNDLVAQGISMGAEAAGITIDILGLDACIMSTLEAAYEFRGVAGILVASQELEQSYGWDYADLLARLAADPGMTPRQLATEMVDSYRGFAERSLFRDQTLSAVELGDGIAFLAQQVETLANRLLGELDDPSIRETVLSRVSEARGAVQEFDPVTHPATYVDLFDLDRLIEGEGGAIQATLTAITIAEYHGCDRGNAHGMSIVFFDLPRALSYSTMVYDPDYTDFNAATGRGNRAAFLNSFHWDEFMHAFFSYRYPSLPH